jgi:hypothetical protein
MAGVTLATAAFCLLRADAAAFRGRQFWGWRVRLGREGGSDRERGRPSPCSATHRHRNHRRNAHLLARAAPFVRPIAKFRAEMLEAAGFRISLEIPYGRIYEPYAVRLRAWLGDVVAALVGHRGVRRASAGWRSEWRRRTPACTRGGRSSEGAMARARSARGSPR